MAGGTRNLTDIKIWKARTIQRLASAMSIEHATLDSQSKSIEKLLLGRNLSQCTYESPQKVFFFLFSGKLSCHKKCTNLRIATEILSGCSQLQPLVPILEETYSKQGIAMGASSLLSWARLAAPCRDCRGRSCRAR